ncbi:MAG: TetR family transcriptional regulator [Polyangiales bacterium]
MDDRAKRIVETAVALAERDGYSAVRLRDVAATAQVALGTVYKRFGSKEEILIAALEQESEKLMTKLGDKVPPGDTAADRVQEVFRAVTRGLLRRPNLASALVRSVASADASIIKRVESFHRITTILIIAAIRGEPAAKNEGWDDPNSREFQMATVLQQVWFAAMVGWAGGMHDASDVLRQVQIATEMILN